MPDLEKITKAFDDAKELVWREDDEYTVGYNNGIEAGKNIALALLKEQPEVVTCRDCKHWEPERDGHCPYNHIFTVPDWFCADGERR